MNKRLTLVVSVVLAFVMGPRIGHAYPTCAFVSYPDTTLAEMVANADSVALVEWVRIASERKPQQTEFLIKRIGKGEGALKVGERKTLTGFRPGMPGDLRIMFGVRKKKSGQIAWGLTKTSERAFNFAMASPSPKIATEKRLAFYVRHLEHADEFIAKDAYIEFLNAGIEDYRKISMDLPREKLLAWTLDDNPESRRQGVYGILLGICGDGETARKLESRILEDDTQFRIGIDGVMSGYLMLTGEEGLDLLEPRKFREGVAFVETYALLQAVRFMWRYGEGRISDARLQQSVRILLDNPDVVDLIIPDLARMEDWSCLDRIVALYDREKFNTPATKRAIIRYLLISSREVVFKLKDDRNLTDEISRRSKEHLDAIRKRDPRQVTQVLRFSILWK